MGQNPPQAEYPAGRATARSPSDGARLQGEHWKKTSQRTWHVTARKVSPSARRVRLGRYQYSPTDIPASDHGRRQVSWLAGRRLPAAFPGCEVPVGDLAEDSPLTVAGAAAALATQVAAPHSLLIPIRGTVGPELMDGVRHCQSSQTARRPITPYRLRLSGMDTTISLHVTVPRPASA